MSLVPNLLIHKSCSLWYLCTLYFYYMDYLSFIPQQMLASWGMQGINYWYQCRTSDISSKIKGASFIIWEADFLWTYSVWNWSMYVGIGGFIDPKPQMALIYPEQKQCAAEREPVHFPLEWNLKEVSQKTWVSQGFKPNFADSGVKSTELDKLVCFGFFLPLYKWTICAIISNTGREPPYSVYPRFLASDK